MVNRFIVQVYNDAGVQLIGLSATPHSELMVAHDYLRAVELAETYKNKITSIIMVDLLVNICDNKGTFIEQKSFVDGKAMRQYCFNKYGAYIVKYIGYTEHL